MTVQHVEGFKQNVGELFEGFSEASTGGLFEFEGDPTEDQYRQFDGFAAHNYVEPGGMRVNGTVEYDAFTGIDAQVSQGSRVTVFSRYEEGHEDRLYRRVHVNTDNFVGLGVERRLEGDELDLAVEISADPRNKAHLLGSFATLSIEEAGLVQKDIQYAAEVRRDLEDRLAKLRASEAAAREHNWILG